VQKSQKNDEETPVIVGMIPPRIPLSLCNEMLAAVEGREEGEDRDIIEVAYFIMDKAPKFPYIPNGLNNHEHNKHFSSKIQQHVKAILTQRF
jgi:hypothetical protein